MDGIKQYVKMHKYGLKCLAIINICGANAQANCTYCIFKPTVIKYLASKK